MTTGPAINISQVAQQRPDVLDYIWKNNLNPNNDPNTLQSLVNTWYQTSGVNEGFQPTSPPAGPPASPPAVASPPATASMLEPGGNTFDPTFYENNNPDILKAVQAGSLGSDPNSLYQHYLTYGLKEGRSGSAQDINPTTAGYNQTGYLNANPDVAKAVQAGTMNPMEHFIQYGSTEGRSPNGNPSFDGTGKPVGVVTPPVVPPAGGVQPTIDQGNSIYAPNASSEAINEDETAAAVARGKKRNQLFSSFLTGGSDPAANQSPFGGAYMQRNTRNSMNAQPSAFGGGSFGGFS